MKADLKAKWIDALRGGEYVQTKQYLRDHVGFCCLGVLCDIQGADFAKIQEQYGSLSLAGNPAEYIGMLGRESHTLADMNDNGASFAEIADFIEANIPAEPAPLPPTERA
jgi:hypothetical protein